MQNLKILFITFLIFSNLTVLKSQNVMINILPQNSGIVKKGKSIFLEVVITNTNRDLHVGIYKIKSLINIGNDCVVINKTGHILPTNWKILAINNNSIELSNAMDMIAASDNRTLLIKLKGIKKGSHSTLSGRINFSDGIAPGSGIGTLVNELPADNFSTTTCTVSK